MFRFLTEAPRQEPKHYCFYLRDGSVGFGRDGLGDEGENYAMDTVGDFHVYRIVLSEEQALLFVDDEEFPVLSAFPTTATADGPRVEFGDIFDHYGSGTVTYDYIRWNNDVTK